MRTKLTAFPLALLASITAFGEINQSSLDELACERANHQNNYVYGGELPLSYQQKAR